MSWHEMFTAWMALNALVISLWSLDRSRRALRELAALEARILAMIDRERSARARQMHVVGERGPSRVAFGSRSDD